MKAIMVMFDSLNLRMLSPYGCEWIKTPNFDRLANKSVTFCNNYVGSLPCMPARRELHTGRYNFLHRSWGPLEPFDDSMPQILKNHGFHTHLVSDHCHYWEDGGATYHTKYSTWECVRGQEGDPWKADLTKQYEIKSGFDEMPVPPDIAKTMRVSKINDMNNRAYMDCEEKQSQTCTFELGLEFLEKNHNADRWFCQIETFDPHEPFYTMQQFKDLYPHEYEGLIADWPPYSICTESQQTINHVRLEYAALVSMCDKNLGKVLDLMDKYDMWQDTMLIVNTDHGYLLGEHGWWAKVIMPVYNEIAHTPLFIYDPRSKVQGEQRDQLTQTIDLPVTILNYFEVPVPKDMQGKDLRHVISENKKVRDYALYGMHGSHVNITDGTFTYMRAPIAYDNKPLYEYTLMPTHMRNMFSVEELKNLQLEEPFGFTKGCKTMKIQAYGQNNCNSCNFGTKLYNVKTDPNQTQEISDPQIEADMLKLLIRAMRENDSPSEQFDRLGITDDEQEVDGQYIEQLKQKEFKAQALPILKGYTWSKSANNMFHALLGMGGNEMREMLMTGFAQYAVQNTVNNNIEEETVRQFVRAVIPKEMQEMVMYFMNISARVD